jgi:hypothetical protein
MMEKKSVDELWESFWKPIVTFPEGNINLEQVKKELADFSFIMEQVPKVYCHITGSTLSKIMYPADTVIRVADDYFSEKLKEAIKDELEEQQATTGAVWVKASERLPGWTHPVHWRIADGPQTNGKIPVCEMSKGVDISVKWEWLYESAIAPNPDELWDEYSEYIDTDIDSCQAFAGSAVMTKGGFKKLMVKLYQQSKSTP